LSGKTPTGTRGRREKRRWGQSIKLEKMPIRNNIEWKKRRLGSYSGLGSSTYINNKNSITILLDCHFKKTLIKDFFIKIVTCLLLGLYQLK
jgi:hypothetical protein